MAAEVAYEDGFGHPKLLIRADVPGGETALFNPAGQGAGDLLLAYLCQLAYENGFEEEGEA